MKENKSRKPLVSILIPLYNAEKYIVETLESCIHQTYKNIEVIVVDDGSKDNSLKVATDYALTHPQVKIIVQQNGGGCKARNTAFANSTGDYIMYLDADDIISDDKIESQVNLLKAEPDTTVATCKWDRFYEELSDAKFPHRHVYKNYDSGLELVEDLLNGGMFGVTCYMTSRQLIEMAGPWDERILVNQDGEFFFRVLLNAKRVIYSDQGALYYRSSDQNSTSRKKPTEKRGNSLIYSYIRELDYAREKGMLTDQIRVGLANYMMTIAYQYYFSAELVNEVRSTIVSFYNHTLPVSIGGKGFRYGCKLIGFWNMIRIKQILKK